MPKIHGRQRYKVSVEFECDVSLRQSEIKEFVETALKAEPGSRNPESPLREIDKSTIKAIPAQRSHRPMKEVYGD